MECSQVKDNLSAYLDGMLDEHTLEMLEAHLAECAACRGEVASLKALIGATGKIGFVRPPSTLKRDILKAITNEQAEDRVCSDVTSLLSAYIDGQLSSAKHEFVRDHIMVCWSCAAEFRAMRAMVQAAAGVYMVEPPSDLRARIAEAVEKTRVAPGARFGRWMLDLVAPNAARIAGGAIAAAVIVLALVMNLTHIPERAQPTATVHLSPRAIARVTPPRTTPLTAPAVRPAQPEEHGVEVAVAASNKSVRHQRRHKTGRMASAARPKPSTRSVVAKTEHPAYTGNENVNPPEARSTEPIMTAERSEPVAQPSREAREAMRAETMRVASADAISRMNTAELLKEAKSEAALRRRTDGPSTVRIISSRF